MPVQINPKPATAPVPAPAPQPSPAPAPSSAVAVEGQPITLPNVEAAPVKVAGAEPVATEGAEFEVLHTIVGKFRRGSYNAGDKIKASDLGEGVDIERLLRLEALKPIEGAAPAPQGETGKPKK